MYAHNPIEVVQIKRYATYFAIPMVDFSGTICEKPNYNVGKFLNNNLTEWDFDTKAKRYTKKYSYFFINAPERQYQLPIRILDKLLAVLRSYNVKFYITDVTPNKAYGHDFDVSDSLVLRDNQHAPVSFMTSGDKISPVELDCGAGKTFMSIMGFARLKKRTLIVVPATLLSQWAFNLEKILPKEAVYLIQGYQTIVELLSNKELRGPDGPMVILATNKTLSQYARNTKNYKNITPFESFIDTMRFGVKVIDEIHMGFHMNTIIDIRCNIPKNIYLSATYKRTSASSKKIFDIIFPALNRFVDSNGNRHVNITEIEYFITQEPIKTWHTETNRGYSQYKYEQFILAYDNRKVKIINKVIKPVILRYFIKQRSAKQKLLIIVGLKEFATFLATALTAVFHDLRVNTYLSGDSDEILVISDIIISTIGSMGTGKDVKGLKSLIAFSSIASDPQNIQLIGRLRKIENETCEFVYLVNSKIESHKRHAKIRQQIFNGRAKTYRRLVL